MSDRLPTVFLGHGSPENAIADNAYTRRLSKLAEELPRPKAILAISAHYMTQGSALTSAEHPRTIHDFYGFPDELYEVEYPAPGDPHLAADVAALLGGVLDSRGGFDHGAWSPMRHIWPDADVPTVELSIDLSMPASEHYELGRSLAALPDQSVLVLGSGNIVHNLGAIDWSHPYGGYEWCAAFDAAVNERLEARDDVALLDYAALPGGRQSVPTPDHYLPLLYAAAAAGTDVPATTFYEGLEYGSLSMRCVRFG
jgi:4,5-DOPA dioxygenase extradiol